MKPMAGHEIKHLRPAYQVGDTISVHFVGADFILFGRVIGIRVDHIDTVELSSIRYLVRWDEERSEGWNRWMGEELMKPV